MLTSTDRYKTKGLENEANNTTAQAQLEDEKNIQFMRRFLLDFLSRVRDMMKPLPVLDNYILTRFHLFWSIINQISELIQAAFCMTAPDYYYFFFPFGFKSFLGYRMTSAHSPPRGLAWVLQLVIAYFF